MKKILVIHGPNLDLLGQREPHIYGKVTLGKINKELEKIAKLKKISLKIIQSNHEGQIVDLIGQAKENGFQVIVINPAAYTHTSVAIRDAVSASGLACVEVHLSNIYAREEFRRNSLIAPVCMGQICGFGMNSYIFGLQAAIEIIKNKK